MKSLLLVFWTACLLLNGLAASAQELAIDARFEVSTVIITGSGANFICRATNFDPSVHTISSFTWSHNGTDINISESKYQESAANNYKRSLRILPPMAFREAGTYRCTVEYTIAGQPSASAHEEAILTVGTVVTTSADPKQYGVIGRPAELRCNATGVPTPTVQWYRGESIHFNNILGNSEGPSAVYSIPTVQASDAGNYICNGATSSSSDQKLIEFIVLTPPVVDVSQRKHSAFYDTTLTLDCPINENATIASPLFPRPLYSWSFTSADDGPAIPVSQETSSRYSVDPESGALSVTEVTFGDIGQYECSVRNEAGEGSGVFDVDVPSRPMITLKNPPSVRAVNGSRVLMDCPYISNPLPTVSWFKGGSSEPLPTQNSKYRVYQNGTLVISDFRLPSDYASYRCKLTNTHGTDSLTYTLQIWDTPLGPSSLTLNLSPRSDRIVNLTWTAPTGTAESAIRRGLEFYVIEQSVNGGEYVQVEEVGAAVTTITLTQLLPGEKYEFRVRAGNFAGLGTPSVIASHRPAPRKPSLSSFQAMPLADGRSVLVTWDLEYDGGPNITKFTIEVEDESGAVLTLLTDVSVEKLTITDLEPETQYTFTALAVNSLGSDSLHATQNTTTALPAQPSSLAVNLLSVGTYSLSFSLRQGSQSITHFLVNYTLINSPEPPSQFILAIDDSTHISSMEEIDSSRVTDTEYKVVVRVTGLKQSGEYEFRVAGRSGLGNGEFSDWAWCEKNENVIYVTIAVVMGGMVLVIVVILVAVMIAVCRRRLTRGRKIAINIHGFPRPPIDMEDSSDAFVLKSPPAGHHKQGSFHRTPPIIVSSSTEDKEGLTSSFSFSNGYSHSTSSSVTKLNTQTSISGTNLDTVVDVPNNDLNIQIVKDFHSSTKSVPNTNGCTPPGDVNRQHLCLQTSLNSMNLDNGEHTDGRSVVSVKNYLYVPTKSQDGNTPLSKSSPEINRLSCDSVLDTMATSYMTDV